MKDQIIQNRVNLYKKIELNCDLGRNHGIYFDVKPTEDVLQKLTNSAIGYIAKTLNCFYKEDFIIDEDFLQKYERKILDLPNRTPNGAFHPKRENVREYNQLQRNVVEALKSIGILNNCKALQPCTVRILSGKSSELDHTRPLATTKLHSDAWASHVGDAILGIPLLGDPTTALEFYEPQEVSSDFFSPLKNYDDGLKKFKDKKFLGYARMGYISVFDHSCLHRTSLKGGGIRVSIDFGIIVDNPESLYYDCTKREKVNLEDYRYQYFDLDVYSKLGKEVFIFVEETLKQAHMKYSSKETKTYERATIKIVNKI